MSIHTYLRQSGRGHRHRKQDRRTHPNDTRRTDMVLAVVLEDGRRGHGPHRVHHLGLGHECAQGVHHQAHHGRDGHAPDEPRPAMPRRRRMRRPLAVRRLPALQAPRAARWLPPEAVCVVLGWGVKIVPVMLLRFKARAFVPGARKNDWGALVLHTASQGGLPTSLQAGYPYLETTCPSSSSSV